MVFLIVCVSISAMAAFLLCKNTLMWSSICALGVVVLLAILKNKRPSVQIERKIENTGDISNATDKNVDILINNINVVDTKCVTKSELESYIDFVNKRRSDWNIKFKNHKVPIFIDIETTGLDNFKDKIITLCMIMVIQGKKESFSTIVKYYIFDPLKKSHPKAEKLHGYDDWTTRHQEVFQQRAAEIHHFLSQGTAYVAHNANFDISFLKRALIDSGYDIPAKTIVCTKKESQILDEWPVSLDACIERIGLERKSEIHGAYEDACLTMAVYYSHRGIIREITEKNVAIQNMIEVPDIDINNIPRRNNAKKLKLIKQITSPMRLEE